MVLRLENTNHSRCFKKRQLSLGLVLQGMEMLRREKGANGVTQGCEPAGSLYSSELGSPKKVLKSPEMPQQGLSCRTGSHVEDAIFTRERGGKHPVIFPVPSLMEAGQSQLIQGHIRCSLLGISCPT